MTTMLVTGRSPRHEPPPERGRGGSALRLIGGAVMLIAAFAIAAFGFTRLVWVLEHGGYGTPDMRYALIILGASGALFAGGIATMIWDVAMRYEVGADGPRE